MTLEGIGVVQCHESVNSIPVTDSYNNCQTIRNTNAYLLSNSDYTTNSQVEGERDNQSRIIPSTTLIT